LFADFATSSYKGVGVACGFGVSSFEGSPRGTNVSGSASLFVAASLLAGGASYGF